MRLPRDERFDRERSALRLRHCCEDCGLFDPRTEQCAHEWPTEGHRRADYDGQLAPGAEINFCKEFELA